MGQSSHDELDLVITTMARTIVDNADYFAQLDSIAGDGDFGYSLRNGWEVVLADYDGWDLPTTGAVLKKIGATLAGWVLLEALRSRRLARPHPEQPAFSVLAPGICSRP